MKIGLYGGMANNMYVAAKALHDEGLDICFIRDRTDSSVFSQPVWQDMRWAPTSQEAKQTVNWTYHDWKEREEKLGWSAPKWFKDPICDSEMPEFPPRPKLGNIEMCIILRMLKGLGSENSCESVIRLMRGCDLLLVCGVNAVLMARLSGVRYAICPHGEDIRQASGNYWMPANGVKEYLSRCLLTPILARAFKNADWIGVHDPQGVSFDRCTIPFELKYLPLPISLHSNVPDFCKIKLREKLSMELRISIDVAKYIWLIPSRIDKYWKNQRVFIEAIIKHDILKSSQIIIVGWGKDLEKFRQSIPKNASNTMRILEGPVSKPILYDLYRASDVVVDQFRAGTYGTTLIEAASVGTAVMSFIKNSYFLKKDWSPPPVLNVRTTEEVKFVFDGILSGAICPNEVGFRCHEWMRKVHGADNVVQQLKRQIKESRTRV